MSTVRVVLPPHLRSLTGVEGEVRVPVKGTPTLDAVLDALEESHPVLRGTIRRHGGGERRPLMRFFACGEDLSHEPTDRALPDAVRSGEDVLLVVGAIAGG